MHIGLVPPFRVTARKQGLWLRVLPLILESMAGMYGASKVNSRRSTFEYILKPEVVAIGVRRCGHHRSTAGRDANAECGVSNGPRYMPTWLVGRPCDL